MKCEGKCLDDSLRQECLKCQAVANLGEFEWLAVDYFFKVRHSYRNQTPNGAGNGNPPVLTPVFADWEAALRVWEFPRERWKDLIEEAQMLFYVVTEQVKPEKTDGPFEQPDLEEWFTSRNGTFLKSHEALTDKWLM